MSNSFHNIRQANTEDIPFLLDCSKALLRDSSYSYLKFDPVRTKAHFMFYMERQPEDAIVLLSLDKDGDPVGVIGGEAKPHHFSDVKMAQEYILWGKDSFKLLRAFEEWAKWVKCDLMCIGTAGTEEAPRLKKVYEKLGWVNRESSFIKEI